MLINISRRNYALEPNVRFTPDQKIIIFRSNMFEPTYVFGVEIARATNWIEAVKAYARGRVTAAVSFAFR
jgi:hypothetical protein